jgi:hypothetical protein
MRLASDERSYCSNQALADNSHTPEAALVLLVSHAGRASQLRALTNPNSGPQTVQTLVDRHLAEMAGGSRPDRWMAMRLAAGPHTTDEQAAALARALHDGWGELPTIWEPDRSRSREWFAALLGVASQSR